LLGTNFRVGIPDLQDINVKVNNTLKINNFIFNKTASIPFDLDLLTAPKYNTTTYQYNPEFGNTVDFNILLQGTYTVTQSGTPGINSLIADLSIGGQTGSYMRTLFTVDGTGPTRDFNGNFTQSIILPQDSYLYPNSYKVVLYESSSNGSAGLTDLTASFAANTAWVVTTQNLSAQSTYYLDPTVFTQQNFPGNINQYSDYNSLLNNVYSNRVSNKYYDVDYSNDITNPVNFKSIISQSALYAQVQDSNYILGSAWDKARYSGTKLTSATYNRYTAGDISYAEEAVIDNYSDYFAVFSNNTSADPEYPGGSNFKLIAILDTAGQVYSLTGDNQYLSFVSNIFKKGTSAIAYAKDVSNQNTTTNLTVIEGGAKYQTILFNSGSNTPQYRVKWTNDINIGKTPVFFTTASINTLTDNDQDWLYPFLTNTDDNLGTIEYFRPDSENQNFYFYNKKTNTYPISADADGGRTLYVDTLFPISKYDYIRFGTTGSSSDSGSLDNTFEGLLLFNITNTPTYTTASATSSLSVTPVITSNFNPIYNTVVGSSNLNQNYRIFRRVPDETSVVVSTNPQINITSGEVGILIPENFNPNYDPVAIAKGAGLIS